MGLVSLTAITCAFFLLTSIGQLHQRQSSQSNDDFAEFDDEEFDGVAPPEDTGKPEDHIPLDGSKIQKGFEVLSEV